MRAARAVKNGWDSLAVIYVNEVLLMLEDKIITDMDINSAQKSVMSDVVGRLQEKQVLEPQVSSSFLHFISPN